MPGHVGFGAVSVSGPHPGACMASRVSSTASRPSRGRPLHPWGSEDEGGVRGRPIFSTGIPCASGGADGRRAPSFGRVGPAPGRVHPWLRCGQRANRHAIARGTVSSVAFSSLSVPPDRRAELHLPPPGHRTHRVVGFGANSNRVGLPRNRGLLLVGPPALPVWPGAGRPPHNAWQEQENPRAARFTATPCRFSPQSGSSASASPRP